MSTSLRTLNRALLARQLLLKREKIAVADAVERLLAVQAQLARPPYVALWTRLHGFRRDDLTAALVKRTLVRATSLRGTIHLTTAADFLRFRTTIQPGLDKGLASILKVRIEGADLDAVIVAGRAFFDAPQTFDALRDHFQKKFPRLDTRAIAYCTRLRMPTVQVPDDSPWGFPGQADFVAAERWLKKKPSAKADAAALVLRYLAGYGPASIADAQAWLGLHDLKPVFAALEKTLTTIPGLKNADLFDLPDAPRPPEATPAPLRFLPDYDSAVVARADGRIVPTEHRSKVFLSALRVAPVVLVDGFAAATWKIERKKDLATLTVTPFTKLSAAVKAEVEREGTALVKFVEPEAGKIDVSF
ncbi:MAG TPA: winged helix DNA-binding domain-containing protein [Vicinamibacterales bacterium]|nr:winged helix DNA-binding domain-containing protein [Vicinamibacterales bacterium]